MITNSELRKTKFLKYFLYPFVLLIYSFAILYFSNDLTFKANPSNNSVIMLVVSKILLGIVFLLFAISLIKFKTSKKIFFTILAIGFLVRVTLIFSEPILEDDYYRYLWDGAVTANGINPYEYSPLEILQGRESGKVEIKKITKLADSSNQILYKINNGYLRTIYPIFSQIIFALSYKISPWNVTAWKFILLIFDIITLFLVLIILRESNLPQYFSLFYWLNPIVIHEFFNAGHMDVLAFPFVLLALLMFIKKRYLYYTLFIALAVGFKIWPIVIFPFVLTKIKNKKSLLISSILLLIAISAIISWPVISTKLDESLGLIKYTTSWENNDALYQVINLIIQGILFLFPTNYSCSLCIARWVIVILLILIVFYYAFKNNPTNSNFFLKIFLVTAWMFFISPTEFPWYYTWAALLLVFYPRASFLMYAAFLPLFQLVYRWNYFVWIEHLPIFLIFLLELKGKYSLSFVKIFNSHIDEIINKNISPVLKQKEL